MTIEPLFLKQHHDGGILRTEVCESVSKYHGDGYYVFADGTVKRLHQRATGQFEVHDGAGWKAVPRRAVRVVGRVLHSRFAEHGRWSAAAT